MSCTGAVGGRGQQTGSITVVGLDLFGLAFALFFFFAWSLSPSLLPRDWLFQGIVSGITSVTGYGAGLLVVFFPVRRWIEPLVLWCSQQRTFQVVADVVGVVLAPTTVVATLLVAGNWQRDIDTLMGMPPMVTVAYLRTGLISVAIFVTVLVLSRGLRRVARRIARLLSERLHMPTTLAHAFAPVVVAVAVALFVNEVLLTGSSEAARRVFGALNNSTQQGVVQPAEAERSGSPASAARWNTLGLQGRSFVDGGLRSAELAKNQRCPPSARTNSGLRRFAVRTGHCGPGEDDPR